MFMSTSGDCSSPFFDLRQSEGCNVGEHQLSGQVPSLVLLPSVPEVAESLYPSKVKLRCKPGYSDVIQAFLSMGTREAAPKSGPPWIL